MVDYTDFQKNMEPGAGLLNTIHENRGSQVPSKKVVFKCPFKMVDESTGEEFPAGTLVEISFWKKTTKAGKEWHPGGVSRVGESLFRRDIGGEPAKP